MAASGRRRTLLRRPAYCWIRAAVQFLTGGLSAFRRLKDLETVSRVRDIRVSEILRTTINAALITRNATASAVGKTLHLDTAVVEAYESLFFNVLDRKNDIA